jgi:hypothetical protein
LNGITWHENAPSWETYQEQCKDLDEKQQFLERMNGHDERLLVLHDEIDELKDKDTPENAKLMAEINVEIQLIHKYTQDR